MPTNPYTKQPTSPPAASPPRPATPSAAASPPAASIPVQPPPMPATTQQRPSTSPPYRMPAAWVGMPVLWYDHHNQESPGAGVVTQVFDRMVEVTVFVPGSTSTWPKSNVRHIGDPESTRPELLMSSGVWDHNPFLVELFNRDAALSREVENLKAAVKGLYRYAAAERGGDDTPQDAEPAAGVTQEPPPAEEKPPVPPRNRKKK